MPTPSTNIKSPTVSADAQLAIADLMRQRATQKEDGEEDEDLGVGEAMSEDERADQMRQGKKAKKNLQDAKEKKEKTAGRVGKLKAKAAKKVAGAQEFTTWLLRLSIGDITATCGIASFGLSILYTNVHIFCRAIGLRPLFCELGQEWAPKELKAIGGEGMERFVKKAKLYDIMVIAIADIILLFIIVLAAAILTVSAYIYTNPIKSLLGLAYEGIKNAMESLFNI